MKAGIVGAGIMGRLLALKLSDIGAQITLFDKDAEEGYGSCSMAAAGLLTPFCELEKSDPLIFQLGNDAVKNHWPTIIHALSHPVFFQTTGTLIVAHPHDKPELERFINLIKNRTELTGHYKKLSHDDIIRLEAEINKFDDGYYFTEEGQLDNQTLLASLRDELHKKNIAWFPNTEVQDVHNHNIILKNETLSFDWVFDCRGLGAKSLFTDLRGVRGELIWVQAPEVHITRPVRLLHPRYSLYIVPRPHHQYILGATEIESEDNSAISVRGALELLSAAFYVHPGFADARIINTVTQCRPAFPNHLPQIKYDDGLIAVNGLYRHGFLIAPVLVEEIVRYLQRGISTVHYPQLWKQ